MTSPLPLGPTAVALLAASVLAEGPSTSAAPRPRRPPTFVVGKTATSPPRPIEECFPDPVPKHQAAAAPSAAPPPLATLSFVVEPKIPVAGESFEIQVFLKNEGRERLRLKDLIAMATTDGKTTSGPLPLPVDEVAPGETVRLIEAKDVWKAPASFFLRVRVRASHEGPGETVYVNQLSWY